MARFDVTRLVIKKTNIGKEINKLKESICTGNQRASWLEKAYLYVEPPNSSRFELIIKLRNRQIWESPLGDVTVYSDTRTAKCTAAVDSNCLVGAYIITSTNDIYKYLAAFATVLSFNDSLNMLITDKLCSLIKGQSLVGESESIVTPSLQAYGDRSFELSMILAEFQECSLQMRDVNRQLLDCTVNLSLNEIGKSFIQDKTYGCITSLESRVRVCFRKEELVGSLGSEYIQLPEAPIEMVINPDYEPGRLMVTANVHPIIFFSGRHATVAYLNMNNIEGIPAFLAEILELEINNSAATGQIIVDFVNACIDAIELG
jgi:hypothetical protein